MDGTFGNLRLLPMDRPISADGSAESPALPVPPPDPLELANRELIRPPTHRRTHRGIEPFSAAWFDEVERKRYARHGAWLPTALEFGRHPGESVLVIGPGIGSDVVSYLRLGTVVTVCTTPADYPDVVRQNLARRGLSARLIPLSGAELPFPSGAFDVAVWNALHGPPPAAPNLPGELFRVLKAGGKVIGLFPARYDTGFWEDRLLPLHKLFWRRPPDPTAGPKTTARELRRAFAAFAEHRVRKRHLRRGEMPHPWRLLPVVLLERLIGRVLVLKAFKPLPVVRPAPVVHPRAA
ncbi:MAG: class I SAM-dependent methyltransferase [Gemmataceae bacterium]|nr:class I SAM-dependent methyltransferase [Gemmataceae bacterium]